MNRVQDWARKGNELALRLDAGQIALSFAEPDVLRIRATNQPGFRDEETFVVCKKVQGQAFTVSEVENSLWLKTSELSVNVTLPCFGLLVHDLQGSLVFSTPELRALDWGEQRAERVVFRCVLAPDERIYGLGQDPMAHLDQRDAERRMWHEWGGHRRSGNAGMPFMLSSRGYGLLLNSSWPARFAVGRAKVAEPPFQPGWAPAPWPWNENSGETHPDETAVLLDDSELDLFLICRSSLDAIHRGYMELTGYPPLPPRWALGFMQCKNRYRSQAELLSVAHEYRRRGIPCDVLVIDWLWFKEFGDLEWAQAAWPDPPGMLQELAEMGFHVLQAQHPFVERNSLKYEVFEKKGYLNKVPEGARPTFDHSNPQARQAWWEEIKRLYCDGIRGYWTDMGEIEQHYPGMTSHLGCRERVHNIYSTMWTQGLYEGQRKDFAERVFSLPRTAYPGIQRNGAALWSGDIDTSWEVLRDQVVIGQGVCLSGQPYWTTDIGGFFTDDRFTAELYVRWLQWGAFCPIFRTHGTRPTNEVYSFTPEAEDICANFIRLRYRLMPYIYSCARRLTEKGTPLMRALCVDFADDDETVRQETQFMFGPALMIAPVLEPNVRWRDVYLPEGVWYDFWTGAKYRGKRWIKAPAPLSRIPIFVKGGSIIPLGPLAEYAGQKPDDWIEIHVFPGEGCAKPQFELYEDDGLTYAYESGAWAKTLVTYDPETGEVKIGPPTGNPALIPSGRQYRVSVHQGIGDGVWDEARWGCVPIAKAEEASAAEDVGSIRAWLDTNLEGDGTCHINLLAQCTGSAYSAKIKGTITVPPGWVLGQCVPAFEQPWQELVHIHWTLKPAAQALPLAHTGTVAVRIETAHGEIIYTGKKCFTFGSGYATRWQVVGYFDNQENLGLAKALPVEENPALPEYHEGERRLAWGRNPGEDFNLFGYVDFRHHHLPTTASNHGIAYARCRTWSEMEQETYLEVVADPGIKVWVNGESAYHSEEVVLGKTVETPVLLRAGWNDVLVKVAMYTPKPYSGREFGFKLRIMDADGRLSDLLYCPC